MNAHEQSPLANAAKRDHRQEVTDSIVRMLEEGVAPWQKPWESAGLPFNPTTEKTYRSGNAVHLMATGLSRGYEDPRWMTYKQAAENGWQVRKGEKGTHIEFWEVKAKADEKNGGAVNNGSDQSSRDRENPRRFIHRVYTVFNAIQIEGVPALERRAPSAFEAVHSGERILENSGAKISHDQRDSAFYRPFTDSIHLPPKEAFSDAPGYYGTALHEMSHWTGHPSRLNRPTLTDSYRFGDLNYAKEELRAELASVFIAAEVGVPHNPVNHAAYIGSWIKSLKEDKNEIFRAAQDASAAADFVLNLDREVSRAEDLEISESAASGIERAQVIRDETRVLEHARNIGGSTDRDRSTGAEAGPGGDGERESSRFVARFEAQRRTVAVHDKRLGTDQHTPIDALTKQNSEDRDAPRPPDQARHNALNASFAVAKSIGAEKLGDSARTFGAQTQSGHYRGEIIGETDLHVVQRLSPGSAVAHMKHLLESVPKVGDNVGIGYANDRASVKELRERSRDWELAR
jgi:antirestriction protein ArdC